MFGHLISGFLNSRVEAKIAREYWEQAARENRMIAMRRQQEAADEFMRQNGCKMVLIKPDGTMVAGD